MHAAFSTSRGNFFDVALTIPPQVLAGIGHLFNRVERGVGKLRNTTEVVADASGELVEYLRQCPLPPCSEAARAGKQVSASAATVNRIVADVDNVVHTLSLQAAAARDLGQEADKAQSASGWSWAGVTIAFMAAYLASTVAWAKCEPVNKVMAPLGLFVLFVTFAIAALTMGLSMVGSDYCAEPTNTTIRLIDERVDSEFVMGTVEFYLRGCSRQVSGRDLHGVINDAEHEVDAMFDRLHSFGNQIEKVENDRVRENVNETFQTVLQRAREANSTVSSLVDAVSCRSIRSLWIGFLNALCTEAVSTGTIPLWGVTIVSAALLTCILGAGVSLCRVHPSKGFDRNGERDSDSETREMLSEDTSAARPAERV